MRDTVLEHISKLFLFRGLDFDAVNQAFRIGDRAVVCSYPDGALLLSGKEAPVGLAVLTAGQAQILSGDEKHPTLLRTIPTGGTFGAATLFIRERDYRTCVRALGACTIAYLPADLVEEICANMPEAARNYIAFLSDRVSFLNRRITAYTAGSAKEKLVLYLLHLPLGADGSWELDVPYSSLSDHLGVGRASLYRAMDELCNKGLIRRDKKKVTPLQPEQLQLMIQ